MFVSNASDAVYLGGTCSSAGSTALCLTKNTLSSFGAYSAFGTSGKLMINLASITATNTAQISYAGESSNILLTTKSLKLSKIAYQSTTSSLILVGTATVKDHTLTNDLDVSVPFVARIAASTGALSTTFKNGGSSDTGAKAQVNTAAKGIFAIDTMRTAGTNGTTRYLFRGTPAFVKVFSDDSFAVGYVVNYRTEIGAGSDYPDQISIVKYLADGSRDNTFGTYGVVNMSFDNTSGVGHTLIGFQQLSDGRYVVGAMLKNATGAEARLGLAWMSNTGSLDTTFGNNGKAIYVWSGLTSGSEVFGPLTLDSGNKVIVARTRITTSADAGQYLHRFALNGKSLDSTWGSQGSALVTSTVSDVSEGNALLIYSNSSTYAGKAAILGTHIPSAANPSLSQVFVSRRR